MRSRDKRGPVRGGRRRHAVPRRGRRAAAGAAGQAAARAAGGARSGASATPTTDQGRRAAGRGDAARPRGRGRRRAGSARTSTTGSTSCRCACRRCASAPRTSRCSRALFVERARAQRPRLARRGRRARGACAALGALALARQRPRAREHDRAGGRALRGAARSTSPACPIGSSTRNGCAARARQARRRGDRRAVDQEGDPSLEQELIRQALGVTRETGRTRPSCSRSATARCSTR